jgi:hypothetical protein
MQLNLIALTEAKETIRYCKMLGYSGKMLSTHITNDLARVSVPAEDGS